ncbi:hypothetical protein QC761_0065110 [Podospora bellae-mahoneyi]|uniref:Uncharacterized protein n=1 Tax=Podospora bellae-mahoneyi TaxID=2093777 RepID=A0ABR0FJM7_9PEZI|nr:hypothetical protein QC761_0065110 [Podospora bellae-mahoneyi]
MRVSFVGKSSTLESADDGAFWSFEGPKVKNDKKLVSLMKWSPAGEMIDHAGTRTQNLYQLDI